MKLTRLCKIVLTSKALTGERVRESVNRFPGFTPVSLSTLLSAVEERNSGSHNSSQFQAKKQYAEATLAPALVVNQTVSGFRRPI